LLIKEPTSRVPDIHSRKHPLHLRNPWIVFVACTLI
jgi:hypothetical protein